MMDGGKLVSKYQFAAALGDGVVDWSFAVQTDDGRTHTLPIRDGEEVPILQDMCRGDLSVFYDADARIAQRLEYARPSG